MRFSRLFSVIFLSVVLGCLLAIVPLKSAHAITARATFSNRYIVILNDLSITQQDIDDDNISNDLDDFSVTEINQMIADQLDEVQLLDSDMADNNRQYVYSSAGCQVKIELKDGETGTWYLTQIEILVSGMGCVDVIGDRDDFPLGPYTGNSNLDTSKSNVWFTWEAANTMVRVDGKEGKFIENKNGIQSGKYFRIEEAGQGDQDHVDVAPTSDFKGGHYIRVSDNNIVDSDPVVIDGVANRRNPAIDYDAAAKNASNEAVNDNSCESQGGKLGWISCPIVEALDGALNWLDTQIQALLEINTDKYTDPQLKEAWVNIRNIAYILLIPVMLIMVIGTALGFEVFSAYTVKKALPRMIIATVFITFSWYICVFLISLTNVIGGGVLGILTQPFGIGGQMNLSTLFEANVVSGAVQWAGASAVLIGLAGFITLTGGAGLAILGSYLFGAVLFVGAAFLVLVMRQMFIIGLMLLAPLAILAWIFPGNDKPWNLWWGIFTKLLIMFPLIMGIIAIGRIFAKIISDAGGNGILTPLLMLTAYIVPYLFIPFTFRFAGGIFANLSGMVNDRNKGLFDRMKKVRQTSGQQIHQETMGERNRLGKGRTGSLYRRAASFGRNGSFSMTSSGRERWGEQQKKIREGTADKMLEEGGGRAFNDDDTSELLRQKGMTKGKFIEAYTQKMIAQGRVTDPGDTTLAEQALARAELAVGAKVGTGSMVVAAQKFRTAMTNTGYAEGAAGLDALQKDLVELQNQGLITAADAAGWMKANRGRADISANGFVETINFAQGYKVDAAGAKTAVSGRDQLSGAFRGADPREIVGGHQRAVESFAEQAQINLENALQSGSQQEVDNALADVANIYDTLSNISPKKASVFAENVLARGVMKVPEWDATGKPIKDAAGNIALRQVNTTVRTLVNEARTRPAGPNGQQTFLDRRREYATASDAHSASAIAEATKPPEPTG